MTEKKALELRKRIKQKKPAFERQDAHKQSKLSSHWRRPKGLQSKVRLQLKGYRRRPKQGWGSPKEVRGLSPEGLEPVVVYSVAQLLATPKDKGIVIGATVGTRKRVAIVETAMKENYQLLNVKGKEYLESVKIQLQMRKDKKEKRSEDKKKKDKEKEKAAKEKAAKEEKEKKEGLEGKVDKQEKKEEKTEDTKKPVKEPKKETKPEESSDVKEKKELDKLLTQKS